MGKPRGPARARLYKSGKSIQVWLSVEALKMLGDPPYVNVSAGVEGVPILSPCYKKTDNSHYNNVLKINERGCISGALIVMLMKTGQLYMLGEMPNCYNVEWFNDIRISIKLMPQEDY